MKTFFLVVLLATLAVFAAAQRPAAVQITNGPVVEAITKRSAVIAWSTNTGGSSVVKYGTNPNNLNQRAESPYREGSSTHRVRVKNLFPNTAYYFQVVSGEGQGTGTAAQSEVLQPRTPQFQGTLIPLYHLVNGDQHLFTTNYSETEKAASGGFKMAGIAGYLSQTQVTGSLPLFRFVSQSGDHFYTTSDVEKASIAKQGYTLEGTTGYIASSQLEGTSPLHRLVWTDGKLHFYTTNQQEMTRDKAAGWKDEGVAGYVWTEDQR